MCLLFFLHFLIILSVLLYDLCILLPSSSLLFNPTFFLLFFIFYFSFFITSPFFETFFHPILSDFYCFVYFHHPALSLLLFTLFILFLPFPFFFFSFFSSLIFSFFFFHPSVLSFVFFSFHSFAFFFQMPPIALTILPHPKSLNNITLLNFLKETSSPSVIKFLCTDVR